MSKLKLPRRLIGMIVAVTLTACVVTGLHYLRRSGARQHRIFPSPDNRFQIVVYRVPALFALPGQSSDAPGYFQLRETQSGRVLKESSVEMVQLVERVEWSPTHVNVHLLADWSLPE
jgi:hypothetical protein